MPSIAQSDTTQKDSVSYIQLSGFIMDADTLIPVPFAYIADKTRKRAVVGDGSGYFTIVSSPGNTIRFSSIGYKDSYFTVPDTLTDDKYTVFHLMTTDTTMLKATVVYPWPSKEEFADAFVHMDIPDDDLARAQRNLDQAEMRDRALALAADGSLNYKWDMAQIQQRLYYQGQAPPIQLLNPMAWAKFIKAWKDGDFKKKDR